MNQRTRFRALAVGLRALTFCCLCLALPLAAEPSFDVIRDEIANHPGQTGAFVLDTGEEALLARAWLVDHAEKSIEVQYFIWSTDNIGILASELDPRSENLNTEVGLIVRDPVFARRVQTAIEEDMLPANSWSSRDDADKYVPLTKRGRVRLWQLLPLKPIL